jgi:hypothetical protein
MGEIMTTRFSSKEQALAMGLSYAGSKQKAKDLKVTRIEKMKNPPFADDKDAFDVEIYEVEGEKGKIELGIEQCEGTFFLWLIDIHTGMSVRT